MSLQSGSDVSELNLVDSYMNPYKDDNVTDFFNNMASEPNAYSSGSDRLDVLNRTMDISEREDVNDLLRSSPYKNDDYKKGTDGNRIFGCVGMESEIRDGVSGLCFSSCKNSSYKPDQYSPCDTAVFKLKDGNKLIKKNNVSSGSTVILIIPDEMEIPNSVFNHFQDIGVVTVLIYIKRPGYCKTKFYRRETIIKRKDILDGNHSGGVVLFFIILLLFIFIVLGVSYRWSRR